VRPPVLPVLARRSEFRPIWTGQHALTWGLVTALRSAGAFELPDDGGGDDLDQAVEAKAANATDRAATAAVSMLPTMFQTRVAYSSRSPRRSNREFVK
jgi:hypothetical protein